MGNKQRDYKILAMKQLNINTLVLHRIVREKTVNFEDITEDILEKILQEGDGQLKTIEKAFLLDEDEKSICLTFDDGYKSDVEIVLPKLLKIGGEATFFIVKDYLNNDGFMCDKDVLQLSNQGMQIGSHSMTHPNFLQINNSKRMEELISSKKYLEDITSRKVSTFSFPFGFINESLIEMVFEAGYEYCCTSQHGLSNKYSTIIPRNSINGGQNISTILRSMNPTFLTRTSWYLEDSIKSRIKAMSPRLYKKMRNLISRH